jgi:mono/diheme cytochrome c family protein
VTAKDDETYAGIPAMVLRETIGVALESLVPKPQPLVFDGQRILSERWPVLPDAGYPITPQRSATWYAGYEAFKRGEQLALPYFDPRPTDPTKQAALTDAYERYRLGQLRAEDLPDLSDIYPDDAQVRAEIGLQTEPGATPAQTLVQACGSCHNDVLDQSISRARFTIALSRLDPPELDLATERLNAPRGSAGAMPPLASRQLDPGALAALTDYLKQGDRSAEDDAMLERAARLGMAGGAPSGP